LSGASGVGERIGLVDETFGMHPAEAMPFDVELTGVVVDNDPCRR
jgi:hypothetical protein